MQSACYLLVVGTCLQFTSYVRLHSVSRSHKQVRHHFVHYIIIFVRAEGPGLRPKAACRRSTQTLHDHAIMQSKLFFVGLWLEVQHTKRVEWHSWLCAEGTQQDPVSKLWGKTIVPIPGIYASLLASPKHMLAWSCTRETPLRFLGAVPAFCKEAVSNEKACMFHQC